VVKGIGAVAHVHTFRPVCAVAFWLVQLKVHHVAPLCSSNEKVVPCCCMSQPRLSNTAGNPGSLLELFFPRYFFPPGNPGNVLEIYKVSWKFSGLVCDFACFDNISYD